MQKIFCYRAGNETRDMELGKKKERCSSAVSLLVAITGVALETSGGREVIGEISVGSTGNGMG